MIAVFIEVESDSGYRADERPFRFVLSGRTYEVVEGGGPAVFAQGHVFQVVAFDGNRYALRHDEDADLWSEAFREVVRNAASLRLVKNTQGIESANRKVFSVFSRTAQSIRRSGASPNATVLDEVTLWTRERLLKPSCWR
jgi:hypothetical protein